MKEFSYRIWVLILGIAVAVAITTVLLISNGPGSILSGDKTISGKDGKTAGWFLVKKMANMFPRSAGSIIYTHSTPSPPLSLSALPD